MSFKAWINSEFYQIDNLDSFELFDEITVINCSYMKLTDLRKFPKKLRYLDCSNNQLTELKSLPDNLKFLICSNNQITNLEVPNKLCFLNCHNNKLTKLIFSDSLQELVCSSNNITELGDLHNVTELWCQDNDITKLTGFSSSLTSLRYDVHKVLEIDELPLSLEWLNGESYKKTKKVMGRKVISKVPTEERCMISLQELKDRKYEECVHCKKPYLLEYILKWLDIRNVCPYCHKQWIWNEYIYKN